MTFCICSSVAVGSITITMGSSISFSIATGARRRLRSVRGQPLQAARFVDDTLEHPLHRHGIEGPGIVAHHALQDPGLALRRVHGQPQAPLDAADLDRTGGPAVEPSPQLALNEIHAAPPPRHPVLYIALPLPPTCPSTSPYQCP